MALTRLTGDTDPDHLVALYEDQAAQAAAIRQCHVVITTGRSRSAP